ncbi:hypothetical protein Bccel_2194 [Pseudobacteroides cellulosolvens ATCC 35603 = DSM 2933]|uniref:Uncharacterized protein n=1 Tax=Pseudobacteroides cellulosolvens ATCC 35603 = DSM 2933 TaxID=398512 RepID=A0A0L6JMD1_9FIRM|nr:hypothetical protein Bccel_2194 [Pseudobacteroides cellulosolvens ATCC 35603 = DSM 2933]
MDITKLNRIKDKIRLNGYQMKPVLSNEEVDDFEKRC